MFLPSGNIELFLTGSFKNFVQALEEAAAYAADEEKKRLQTQTELQDRYRMDLEREKMVNKHLSFTESLHHTKSGATTT